MTRSMRKHERCVTVVSITLGPLHHPSLKRGAVLGAGSAQTRAPHQERLHEE